MATRRIKTTRADLGLRSKREVESQGGHEIVDRVLLDDRHPDLERHVEKITELLADLGVEGQEKAPVWPVTASPKFQRMSVLG